MEAQPLNVLFVCTANSARSILAEAILNHLGAGTWRGYSAGSRPGGALNPHVVEFLEKRNLRVAGARSKSWEEFAGPGAPQLDCVITVCDQAAGETCPVWPGAPIRAHWGVEDPARAGADADQGRRAVQRAFEILWRRIEALVAYSPEATARATLRERLREIGEMV